MTPSSAKQKGRILQQKVRDELLKTFPSLTLDDVRSTAMGSNGADLLLSTAAKALIPYSIECKNQETTKGIYKWIDQAASGGNLEPLVVFKGNRRDPHVIVSLKHFLELIKHGPTTS